MIVITKEQVTAIAKAQGVPPDVLYGVIGTESSFDDRFLVRFEPHVAEKIRNRVGGYARYATGDERELQLLASSLGVGQVMGYNYREMGYDGPLEDMLTDHETAAAYAARFLRLTYNRVKDNQSSEARDAWEKAVQAYNTGGTDRWPVEHMRRFRNWRALYEMKTADEVDTTAPGAASGLLGIFVLAAIGGFLIFGGR